MERPFAGRGADRAAHSRRHRGARAARPQGHSVSLLVVIGVRAEGQKVLLAIKSMGGESAKAWRGVLDDLVRRGLRRPEFLIVDGAPGLDKAIAAVRGGVPVQRCTMHKHRNLLVHAAERLHEEITADYRDMIYATTCEEIEARRKVHPQMAAQAPRRRRQSGGCRRAPVRLHPACRRATGTARTTDEMDKCDRTTARGVQATDQMQNVLPSADTAAMLFWPYRWLADTRDQPHRSANSQPEQIPSCYPEIAPPQFQPLSGRHQGYPRQIGDLSSRNGLFIRPNGI